MDLRHHPGLRHRPTGLQGRGQIQATEQSVIPNLNRNPHHRRARRQQGPQRRQPGVAHRAMRTSQRHSAQAVRIDRNERSRLQRVKPSLQ
jgi:hypothetical protein